MDEGKASQRAKCEFFSIFFVILSLFANLAKLPAAGRKIYLF